MRFLADESCDFSIVRELRAHGFDVIAVSEISPRLTDREVIALAQAAGGRVVLTEDKDFGQLVFASGQQASGVLLIRGSASARSALLSTVLDLVRREGEALQGRFTVVQPGRVRMSRIPRTR